MRAASLVALLGALSACAGSDAHATMHLPDWRGPAVLCRHLADGAMQIEMVVPTGGHQLALREVRRDGGVAVVQVDYAPPAGELVTQVITTLRLDVPAAQLGDATVVLVEVQAAGAAVRLAVATARPWS